MPILLLLGTVKESGAKHKGLIEIPSLSEENEVGDTEVPARLSFLVKLLLLVLGPCRLLTWVCGLPW